MRLKSIEVLRGYAMGKTQLSRIVDNIEREVEEALEFERSENTKLRELVRGFLYEHADYIAEGNYSIGDLDLEHAMHHNQAYFTREAKKLGVEVDS